MAGVNSVAQRTETQNLLLNLKKDRFAIVLGIALMPACSPDPVNPGSSPEKMQSDSNKNEQRVGNQPAPPQAEDARIGKNEAIEIVRKILSTNVAWSGTGITYSVRIIPEGFHVLVIADNLEPGSHRGVVLDNSGKIIRNSPGL